MDRIFWSVNQHWYSLYLFIGKRIKYIKIHPSHTTMNKEKCAKWYIIGLMEDGHDMPIYIYINAMLQYVRTLNLLSPPTSCLSTLVILIWFSSLGSSHHSRKLRKRIEQYDSKALTLQLTNGNCSSFKKETVHNLEISNSKMTNSLISIKQIKCYINILLF